MKKPCFAVSIDYLYFLVSSCRFGFSGNSRDFCHGDFVDQCNYLEEAKQEPEVEAELVKIRAEYAKLSPEEIRCIDPCQGSGHILVYLFDVLIQIYEAYGYTT